MPSGAEILRDHESRIKELERLVVKLLEDQAESRDWLEEDIDLGGDAPSTADIIKDSAPEPATVDEDAGEIRILPPNRKQRKFREAWLDRIALENLPKEWGLSKEEADAAYMEGGPVWLYLAGAGFAVDQKSGRDYVMSLPPEVRACMVNDLEMGEVSPRWIHEFARDILKVDGEESRRAAETFAEQVERDQTGKGK